MVITGVTVIIVVHDGGVVRPEGATVHTECNTVSANE